MTREDQYPAYCIDTLLGRLPETMFAVLVDTQQDRVWTCVGRLEGCGKLHDVGGNCPQIVFRCGDKCGQESVELVASRAAL